MHKDHLDTSVYRSPNKKDYRTAKTLNLEKTRLFFENLGYSVVSIDQKYRHAHGVLHKKNQYYHFKIASRKTIGELTYNEKVWNDAIGKMLKSDSQITVPKNVESGLMGTKFYLVTSYHQENYLLPKKGKDTANLEKKLSDIIDFNVSLIKNKALLPLDFPRDVGEMGKVKSYSQYFSDVSHRLNADLEEFKLSAIQKIVTSLPNDYQSGPSHGDFIPWHLLEDDGKMILIDGELASARTPLFYDVAYLFEKIYVEIENEDLAYRYIEELKMKLDAPSKLELDRTILPLIAYRCFWGFWRAKNYGETDFLSKIKLANKLVALYKKTNPGATRVVK